MGTDRETDVARLAEVLAPLLGGSLGPARLDMCTNIAAALMPVVDAIARQRAAEAVQPFEDLFSGGPDTACRTTWHGHLDCVEVPMADLRDAFARAAVLRGPHA